MAMGSELTSMLLETCRPLACDASGPPCWRMWQECLRQRAFGYSAHDEAIVWALPDL